MTIIEGKNKVLNAGIRQLRNGETLQDALDFLDGKLLSRKGYDFKHDDGTLMDQNQIISKANKEAFGKTIGTRPDYNEFSEEDIENWDDLEDYRTDTNKKGELQPCQYCGTALLVDEGANFDILNCEKCHSYAVWDNCI